MGVKKIVFLRCAPLSKLVYESVFIKELINKGFKVEYIDTTLIHSKGFKAEEYNDFKGIVKIKSAKEFKEYLKRQDNSNTLFIELVRFDYKSIRLYTLLKKYNFKLGFFARYAAKSVTVKTNLKQKLSGVFVKLKNRTGLKIAYILKKFGLLKSYDYIFSGGKMAISFFFNNNFYEDDKKSARIINVNANDYDRFLSLGINAEEPKKKYIVFLDQYLPYHPDFLINKKKTLSPEKYYRELNRKFTEIEKVYSLNVVIAAHPKAIRYKSDNPFQGRSIIFNNTIELVAHCSLVLSHYSTSINFAILYQKPIIFLLNSELEQVLPVPAKMILELSNSLKCPISYLEAPFSPEELNVDHELYRQYKYDYMTSPESEKQLTISILEEFLLQVK